MDQGGPQGVEQAGRQLREWLQRPGDYRRRWERYAKNRRGPGQVNYGAVATVLAHYLAEHPETPADREENPRRLKDAVGRALSGKMLSTRMLDLFIAAFDFSHDHARIVRALRAGSERVRFLVGPRAVPPEAAAAFGPPRHRTVSVHEHHFLGADGLPRRHETVQVIEAIEDGLDRYPYRFDTDALTVEVSQGCRGVSGPLYQISPGIYAVDIALDRKLAREESTTLKYSTTFHYRSAPKPEFRRAAQGRIDGVNILVTFDPDKRPELVWWAAWDGIDGEVIAGTELRYDLDGRNTVQRYLPFIEDAVVGFFWTW